MTKITYIPGEIANAAIDEHGNRKPVTRTHNIFDDNKSKNQAEINIDIDNSLNQLSNEIDAVNKQDVISVDTLPNVSTANPKKIYRVVGEDSYTDYMVNASGNDWKKLATYSFPGIDNEPTARSENLVKSGGVANKLIELDNQIEENKNSIGYNSSYVYSHNSLQWSKGAFKTSGTITETGEYERSEPIFLHSGETIIVKGDGMSLISSDYSLIAKTDAEGAFLTNLKSGGNAYTEREYTTNEDIYVVISLLSPLRLSKISIIGVTLNDRVVSVENFAKEQENINVLQQVVNSKIQSNGWVTSNRIANGSIGEEKLNYGYNKVLYDYTTAELYQGKQVASDSTYKRPYYKFTLPQEKSEIEKIKITVPELSWASTIISICSDIYVDETNEVTRIVNNLENEGSWIKGINSYTFENINLENYNYIAIRFNAKIDENRKQEAESAGIIIEFSGNALFSTINKLIKDVDSLSTSVAAKGIVEQNKGRKTYASLMRREYGSNTNKNFSCLFFSDVHGNVAPNVERISELANEWGVDLIDCVINGGDTARKNILENLDWYKEILLSSSIPFLTAIGNHDSSSNNGEIILANKEITYSKFIDAIQQGDVVLSDNNQNTKSMYHYKDFVDSKIRVIVIDCIYWDDEENAWMRNILSDAKINGYSVICVQHAPLPKSITTEIGCTFTSFLGSISDSVSKNGITMVKNVKTFIDNGGQFICWLSGHTHRDEVVKITDEEMYGKQLSIVIGSACGRTDNYMTAFYPDAARNKNDYTYDHIDMVSVDKVLGIIKIMRIGVNTDLQMRPKNFFTYDYVNGKVISNS